MSKNQKGFSSIIFIIIIVVLVGIIGYLLYQNTQEPNSYVETKQALTDTNKFEDSDVDTKSDWITHTSEECGVKFTIPPKKEPYYSPYDPNREPSVTDEAGSGRFWDYPRGVSGPTLLLMFPNSGEQYKLARTMYASDEEASGYVSSAVTVYCIPNTTNLNNQTMLNALNGHLESYNQETDEKSPFQADTYTISTSKEVNRWRFPVLDLTVAEYYSNSGGQPSTRNVEYTIFATPEYIYEVEVSGDSADLFVQKTAQQIFDSLKFED